jgi:hypothetical protein
MAMKGRGTQRGSRQASLVIVPCVGVCSQRSAMGGETQISILGLCALPMGQHREPQRLLVAGGANLRINARAEARPFASRAGAEVTSLRETVAVGALKSSATTDTYHWGTLQRPPYFC